jgi:hypothetical protein
MEMHGQQGRVPDEIFHVARAYRNGTEVFLKFVEVVGLHMTRVFITQ